MEFIYDLKKGIIAFFLMFRELTDFVDPRRGRYVVFHGDPR